MGSEPQLLPKGSRPEILDVSSSPGGSTHISGFRIWNLPQSLLKSPLKESRYPVTYLRKKEVCGVLHFTVQGRYKPLLLPVQKAATPSFPLTLKPKSHSGLLHSSQRAFKVEVSVPAWRCRGNPE